MTNENLPLGCLRKRPFKKRRRRGLSHWAKLLGGFWGIEWDRKLGFFYVITHSEIYWFVEKQYAKQFYTAKISEAYENLS